MTQESATEWWNRDWSCPFEGCDWEYCRDVDSEEDALGAEVAAESHYHREHAGRMRVLVAVELECAIGGREPVEVAEGFADRLRERHEVAWTRTEVLEEASDHSQIRE